MSAQIGIHTAVCLCSMRGGWGGRFSQSVCVSVCVRVSVSGMDRKQSTYFELQILKCQACLFWMVLHY